jgi:hypothetical protein
MDLCKRSQQRTCDAVVGLGCAVLDALLGAADGVCEQGVDARVVAELGGKAGPAGGARLLALGQPALEAGQAEVVLAWALHTRHTGVQDSIWVAGVMSGVMTAAETAAEWNQS